MKTYRERTADVSARIQKRKRRRRAWTASCLSLAVVLVAAMVMLPLGTNPAGDTPYSIRSYDQLAERLQAYNELSFDVQEGVTDSALSSGPIYSGTGFDDSKVSAEANGSYQEVTDNQVEGVTESDLFKRTASHIFYLRGNWISVFSIQGEASETVSTYPIALADEATEDVWGTFRLNKSSEMYLSQDGTVLTVLMQLKFDAGVYTVVVSLDVSDPANITEIGRQYISGSYLTSRMVDGKLLLMSKYYVSPSKLDPEDPFTFVPQLGTPGNMQLVAAEDIVCPEDLSSRYYTVICTLDEKTMVLEDSAACLSFTDNIYVSRQRIYISRGYTQTLEDQSSRTMSEIVCIRYGHEGLQPCGGVCVEGSIQDQYSMDEYNGILRIVTSTNENVARNDGTTVSFTRRRSASLYCVSLETFAMVAAVENFAPEGEAAESVRFDGDRAYVCTAVVVTLTDPVFFFDLSDLDNITYTDTGTIDGYSSSLIQLNDGFLMGVGFSDQRTLKIEVYTQQQGSVISVDSFCMDGGSFSEVYKSYYVDRENNLIGLAVRGNTPENPQVYDTYQYMLLHFDGYSLNVIKTIEIGATGGYCDLGSFRADIIDGYLYVMGNIDAATLHENVWTTDVFFAVEKVW